MNAPNRLIFGLIHPAHSVLNRALAEKLRSFTISWTRYGYSGPILEGQNVNDILSQALARRADFCLIQVCGNVIIEPWTPAHQSSRDFHQTLSELIQGDDFTALGTVESASGNGFAMRCLLVNLRRIQEPDHPGGVEHTGPVEQVVQSLPHEMRQRTLLLQADRPDQNNRFANFLDGAIAQFDPASAGDALSDDQQQFLTVVRRHAAGARRGVFLWNVESYFDVAAPADGFSGPIGTLSCVAAGFKPNMILHTHGFDSSTRVVYFDYSEQALAFRKLLWEEWDGDDYPHFLEYIFRRLSPQDTFYHLWNDQRPDEVTARDFEQAWQIELDRWGGAQALKDHWQSYRRLRHEFVHCNILTEPGKVFERIGTGPNDVIWWSNAFFTVFSNWFHTLPERRAIYDVWAQGLADHNPQLHLYGFDYNNIAVNGIQAQEYRDQYFRDGRDYLNPVQPKLQIRC